VTLRPLPATANPALLKHAEERRKSMENRIADQITRFAGSMRFVYIHIIWFAAWIGFRVEPYPFGLLTMIVSLEAIFLSTFVMISQNRADEKRQVLADHQWQTVQQEEQQNEQLLHISNQILELTKAIHAMSRGQSNGLANQAGDEVDRAPHDSGAEHVRQQGVGEHGTPDPSIADRGVGHLITHADGEGNIGEVAICGLLLSGRVVEGDPWVLRSEVQIGVAQGENCIDYRPRQHDR
jgi:uncharacterized membrane protein